MGVCRPVEPELALPTVIDDYPHTLALKDGRVRRSDLRLEFVRVEPVHRAFAPMVRDLRYAVCEMAAVTYFQARAAGIDLTLVPVTMRARLQHRNLVCLAESRLHPDSLTGRRIGVRSYSQTTGVWVRGILQQTYGLDPATVTWVTCEGAHVADAPKPPNVERLDGESLIDMLRDGRIDAAIFGEDLPTGPEFRSVIEDAAAAAEAWFAATGIVPINHVVVVSPTVAHRRPEVVDSLLAMFVEARALAGRLAGYASRLLPVGEADVAPHLATLAEMCVKQGLLSARTALSAS